MCNIHVQIMFLGLNVNGAKTVTSYSLTDPNSPINIDLSLN
jgi:hypothetical protein